MKALLTAALIVLCASLASADETIGVYGEPDGLRCFKEITLNFPVDVYVLHKGATETTRGCAFKIADTTGLLAVGWGATGSGYIGFGDPYSGIQVNYGTCRTTTLSVVRLTYFAQRYAVSCSEALQVVANPDVNSNGPVAFSCGLREYVVAGGRFSFYPDCGFCSELGVESATWGRVKALYR